MKQEKNGVPFLQISNCKGNGCAVWEPTIYYKDFEGNYHIEQGPNILEKVSTEFGECGMKRK